MILTGCSPVTETLFLLRVLRTLLWTRCDGKRGTATDPVSLEAGLTRSDPLCHRAHVSDHPGVQPTGCGCQRAPASRGISSLDRGCHEITVDCRVGVDRAGGASELGVGEILDAIRFMEIRAVTETGGQENAFPDA